MHNIIVTSTGTSVLTKLLSKEEQDYLMQVSNQQYADARVQQLLRDCYELFKREPNRVMECAELATLSLYAQNVASVELILPNTTYLFLVTDTAVGRFCADVIKEFLLFRYRIDIEIYIVPGLQVEDVTTLDSALHELQQRLDGLCRAYGIVPVWQRMRSWLNVSAGQTPRMILNITGGFKVVSSWLQAYATLNGITTIYKYESRRSALVVLRNKLSNTMPVIEYYYA
jgi:putative CRISPR-associated protein (TIGR02619 family)